MKRIALLFSFLTALPLVVIADPELSKDAPATLSMTTTVQDQLHKLSPSERSRLEASIKAGNDFIPHMFDESAWANNDKYEIKAWERNIRPLVNKNIDEWEDDLSSHQPTQYLSMVGPGHDLVAVCPQIELIFVKSVDGHINLTYRSKIIGTWKQEGSISPQVDILMDKDEEFQEVFVSLDDNNKVDHVLEKYAGLIETTKWVVNMYAAYIKRPEMTSHQPVHYRKLIELIKEEEAAICKAPL